jgi:uncharacterized membrane protein YccC
MQASSSPSITPTVDSGTGESSNSASDQHRREVYEAVFAAVNAARTRAREMSDAAQADQRVDFEAQLQQQRNQSEQELQSLRNELQAKTAEIELLKSQRVEAVPVVACSPSPVSPPPAATDSQMAELRNKFDNERARREQFRLFSVFCIVCFFCFISFLAWLVNLQ